MYEKSTSKQICKIIGIKHKVLAYNVLTQDCEFFDCGEDAINSGFEDVNPQMKYPDFMTFVNINKLFPIVSRLFKLETILSAEGAKICLSLQVKKDYYVRFYASSLPECVLKYLNNEFSGRTDYDKNILDNCKELREKKCLFKKLMIGQNWEYEA